MRRFQKTFKQQKTQKIKWISLSTLLLKYKGGGGKFLKSSKYKNVKKSKFQFKLFNNKDLLKNEK